MDGSSRTDSRDTFRPDIEGLRGIAVLLVVLFHASLLVGLPGGFIGVDVFFVISGFLITGPAASASGSGRGRIALRAFYARRVRRLLPAGLVALVVTLVASFVVPGTARPRRSRPRRGGRGPVGREHPVRARGRRLLRGRRDAVAVPPLLVARGRGAVLPRLAGARARGAAVASAARRCRCRPGHRARRIARDRDVVLTGDRRQLGVLLPADPGLAALARRARRRSAAGPLARIPGPSRPAAGWIAASLRIGVAALRSTAASPTRGSGPSSRRWPLRRSSLAGPPGTARPPPRHVAAPLPRPDQLLALPVALADPRPPAVALEAEPPHRSARAARRFAVAVAVAELALHRGAVPDRLPDARPIAQAGRSSPARRPVLAVVVASGAFVARRRGGAGPDARRGAGGDDRGPGTARRSSRDLVDERWRGHRRRGSVRDSRRAGGDGGAPRGGRPRRVGRGAIGRRQPGAGIGHAGPLGHRPVPSATPSATAYPSPTPRIHKRLPKDVQPPLSEARADEERLRADGCLAFEPVRVPPDCVYGDRKGKVTVALVGDSHAAQWFPALADVARRHHWRVVTFTKVACPFLDMRLNNVALKREYWECAEFRTRTIARLKKLQPDLVLLSMSRFAIHPVRKADLSMAARAAALARVVKALPDGSILLTDTPDARRDVPSCLSRHAANVLRCAVPLKAAFVGRLGRLERLASQATGAAVIDLSSRVCRADPCPVVVDGMIVFRDSRHLTATFAQSLAPDLERELLRYLAPASATPPTPAPTPIRTASPSPVPMTSSPSPVPVTSSPGTVSPS